MKKVKFAFSVLILLLIFAFTLNSVKYIEVSLQGILLWGTLVLPALLPFMFFSKLLISTGFADSTSKIFKKFTTKLFKCPPISAFVYVISIISGYPVGAKLVSELYKQGEISKEEAYKITTFTSTSGPSFIIGTVAGGMLKSFKAGIIIFVSHLIGAIINGILFRNFKLNKNSKNYQVYIKNKKIESLQDIAYNCVSSILVVGVYICIFFLVTEILTDLNIMYILTKPLEMLLGVFNIDTNVSYSIINGLFEITKGCKLISTSFLNNQILITTLITGIITFGGLAIYCQAITFLKEFDMTTSFYFKQKITHTVFSMVICLILCLIFM